MDLWHDHAQKVIIPQAPQGLLFTGGGRKLVWHTTEGTGIGGAVGAYHASGVCPHFTIQVRNGKRTLYQHLPINHAASALRHPPGTQPTNTANAIQVEIVGLASGSGRWNESTYHYLHLLAQWVYTNFGVPLKSNADWHRGTRLGGRTWVQASGHYGHRHCPGNDHTDPGSEFHIGYVLKGVK